VRLTPQIIARRLEKALRREAAQLAYCTLAPNRFLVRLPPDFVEEWAVFLPRLEEELAEHLQRAVESMTEMELPRGSAVEVRLVAEPSLRSGRMRVETSFAAPGPPRLVALEGLAHPLDYPLVQPVTVIGRGEVDLRLPPEHTAVSRRHAQVLVGDAGLVLEDLGSRMGTYVNRRRVTRSPLQRGDLILIGDVVLRLR